MATLTALTAASIADAYRRLRPRRLVSDLAGGGARNPTLVRMLRERLHPTPVLLSEDISLDSDNKEALLRSAGPRDWHARPGAHPALTGARHGSVLGQITPGRNCADLIRRTWCRIAPGCTFKRPFERP